MIDLFNSDTRHFINFNNQLHNELFIKFGSLKKIDKGKINERWNIPAFLMV